MATASEQHPTMHDHGSEIKRPHVGEAANRLLEEGKRFANELYQEGWSKAEETQENVKQYSDEMLKKVQNNPLSSLMIAAGVGFLLSTFLRK